MAQRILAGQPVDVNEEGYFINASQWNRDMAVEMAHEAGIDLTDKHFEVLNLLRDRYTSGASLTIRRIGKSGVVSIKEFYQLFSYYFSLTERAMDGNALLPPPSVKVPTSLQIQQKQQYSQQLADTEKQMADLLAEINYSDPPGLPAARRYAQLAWILRAQTLVDVDCFSSVYGQPLSPAAILSEIKRQLEA